MSTSVEETVIVGEENVSNEDPVDEASMNSQTKELTEDYPFEKTDRNVILTASKFVNDTDKFYGDAVDFWRQIPATLDGMMGGYTNISPTDIMGSQAFLRPFISGRRALTGTTRALDCGSGIGRITKRLLLPLFDTVDMVEQCEAFLNRAPLFIGAESARIGKYICTGLQDCVPDEKAYNVIWVQWVTGHLTDGDFVTFLRRCKNALTHDGLIVVKENVSSSGKREFDQQDSSFTRSLSEIEELIGDAGLSILKRTKQTRFPKYLYNVYMIAVQ